MFDWFVAPLRCPNCGNVTPADSSTNMQTKIRSRPDGSSLRVGDAVDHSPDALRWAGYLPIRPVQPGEPTRILETWECPICGVEGLWAEIVLDQGAIRSIEAVELDRSVLARAHYVSWFLKFFYEEITGQPLYDGTEPRPDFVDLLRAHLPESPSAPE